MILDVSIGTADSHMSLLPEVRRMAPFGRGESASSVPEECWLLYNHHPTVQAGPLLDIWTAFGVAGIRVPFGPNRFHVHFS